MSAVVNNNASDLRYNPQNAWNIDARTTAGTVTTTGSGTIAGVTVVPDPAAPTVMMALMASVDAIMPKMSGENLDALITSFTSKLKDTIDKSDKDNIKNQQDTKRGKIAEKKEKYREAAEKLAEAKDAFGKASLGDKIKLAFQYIGAILTILAGLAVIALSAASMVFTLGLSTPAAVMGIIGGSLLVTSGIIMLTLAADQTVKLESQDENSAGMGMFGRLVKACAKANGQSDEDADKMAQKGAMGITIGLMAIAVLTGAVGMAMAPEGAAADAAAVADEAAEVATEIVEVESDIAEMIEMAEQIESGATDVAQVAEQAEQASEETSDILQRGLQAYKAINAFNNDLSAYSSASTEVVSAVYNKEAQDDQADAKRAQADTKSIEALSKVLDDFIDMAIARLKGSTDRFSAMVDSAMEAVQDTADSMSRARLTG